MSKEDLDFDNIPAETPLSPEEAIIRRHRREKKDLQGKVLAMKKSITKSDKKKKKELADEIVRLEAELEQKHKLELDTFHPKRVKVEVSTESFHAVAAEIDAKLSLKENTSFLNPDINETTTINNTPGTPKLSRAQKRRDKKSTQDREKQKRIDQETELLIENSEWKKEEREMEVILNDLQLQVFDIPADGHCLYSAVSHQFEQNCGYVLSIETLRYRTAEYLLKNKTNFINYFDESVSGSDASFINYCKEIKSTAAWGGQVEVQVLSKVLERPIRVIQATGPPLVFGEEFENSMLTLTYHRHKIQAGEHYNSVIPIPTD